MHQIFKLNIICIFHLLTLISYGAEYSSGVKQVEFIELFSTQSCSSCPPAQQKINSLKGQSELWKTFIPIVYHVDYWDYLGWKDPFSNNNFTIKQQKYVKHWSKSSIYTPMFVINGKEGKNLDLKSLFSNKNVGNLHSIKTNEFQYSVSFDPSEKIPSHELIIHWAILGNNILTNVKSGENSGKILTHDFLVLSEDQKNLINIDNLYRQTITVDIEKIKQFQDKSIVFWVTFKNGLDYIQATGGKI